MRTAPAVTAVLALVVVTIAAQAPKDPVFEAVSIKVNDSGRDGGGATPLRNGRWNATNLSAGALIGNAWGFSRDRVVGLPEWAVVTRYDIAAVAREDATPAQLRAMLQAMLRDRFGVVAHVEQRERPIYNLVLPRADGRIGPSLRKSPIADCLDPQQRATAAAMSPPARPCGFSAEPGNYSGTARVSELTTMLSGASGRPVFDRTGLAGNYEFELRWTALTGDTPATDAVSIFTAVQEQLGLKLETATAPLDVLIVDRIEHPTAN
jgi:uncharacterized protein (TIGR03435 family)